jgi:hypothetical protein
MKKENNKLKLSRSMKAGYQNKPDSMRAKAEKIWNENMNKTRKKSEKCGCTKNK